MFCEINVILGVPVKGRPLIKTLRERDFDDVEPFRTAELGKPSTKIRLFTNQAPKYTCNAEITEVTSCGNSTKYFSKRIENQRQRPGQFQKRNQTTSYKN